MPQQLIVPIVHLNGTGQKGLLEQYKNAVISIAAAQDAISRIETHDRDYYVHPREGAGKEARKQRQAWANSLKTIREHLTLIAVEIQKKSPYAVVPADSDSIDLDQIGFFED